MKRRITVIPSVALVLSLAMAFGPSMTAHAVPSALQHVDPQAPCFRWPAVDMDGDGVFDRIDRCVSTPKGCTVDAYGCSSDADGDGVCDGVDRCPDTPPGMPVDGSGCAEGQLGAAAAVAPPVERTPERPMPAKPAPTGRASEVERQLLETGTIRLENVYFETASARLLPESEETLREVGRTLEKFPDLRIEIEGHTDTRGSAQYNRRLSQSRAESVRAFLLEHHRFEPGNYVARGYGETRPETEERNEEELLRNRRVVLRVLNPEALPRGVEVDRTE